MSYRAIKTIGEYGSVIYTFESIDEGGEAWDLGYASLNLPREAWEGTFDTKPVYFDNEDALVNWCSRHGYRGLEIDEEGDFGISLDNGCTFLAAEEVPEAYLEGAAWDAIAQAMNRRIAGAVGEEIWADEPSIGLNRRFLAEYVRRAGNIVIS